MVDPVQIPPASQLSVAIVGGGAAGLAAAYRLAQGGARVRLFEASRHLGGAVRSERSGEWLVEAGPNSLQENAKELAGLINELGLSSSRVEANPAARNRFIVKQGRLFGVPMSPPALIKTPLLSMRSKLRLLTEVFSQPRQRPTDVSLAHVVREHFGQEIVDTLVNPFVSGIYAGDPDKLSARHAFPRLWKAEREKGSLIRGMIAQGRERKSEGHPPSKIISFRDGLQSLTDALALRLPAGTIETRARVEALLPGSSWKIVWRRDDVTHSEEFDRIILALPAPALASLTVGSLGERPFAALDAVHYPPVTSLFLGFRRQQVKHPLNGFGALIPSRENMNMLGVLFSSTLFAGRAPEDHVALTVMVGGVRRPSLPSRPLTEILAVVLPELRSLLGVEGDPVFHRLTTWPRAIPQYELGYERFLDVISAAEKTLPGLTVVGHVRDGIALPSCLMSGLTAAGQLLSVRELR